MKDKKQTDEGAEKRKTARFIPKENTLAAFGSGLLKVGKVKDISWGGLSFEYLYNSETDPTGKHVDIWISGVKYALRDVPCKKVYDIRSAIDYENHPFVSTIMNRCGLQFGTLSTDQSAKLSSFIRERTISPVVPTSCP